MNLRKQRDQAKKDFLHDRRSGQFMVDTRYDDLAYMSMNETYAMPQESMVREPRSLGYIGAEQQSTDAVEGKVKKESRDRKLWGKTVGLSKEAERNIKATKNAIWFYSNSQTFLAFNLKQFCLK